jgi:hypothetical protein
MSDAASKSMNATMNKRSFCKRIVHHPVTAKDANHFSQPPNRERASPEYPRGEEHVSQ